MGPGWVPGGSNHLLRRWARSPRASKQGPGNIFKLLKDPVDQSISIYRYPLTGCSYGNRSAGLALPSHPWADHDGRMRPRRAARGGSGLGGAAGRKCAEPGELQQRLRQGVESIGWGKRSNGTRGKSLGSWGKIGRQEVDERRVLFEMF